MSEQTITDDVKTQRPQGRPPVPEDERLDRRVPVMFTQKEFERIKAAADREGVTVSAYIRACYLERKRR